MRFALERSFEVPPSAVFEVLRDFRRADRWQTGVEEIQVFPDAPAEVGTVVMERRRVAGQSIELSYKVMEIVPARAIRVESTGDAVGYQVEQTLTPTETGTRLDVVLEVDLRGPMRFAAGIFEPAIRRQAEADLERLADLVASEAARN
jgi:carbon monoxide dehydrogenase subunit G